MRTAVSLMVFGACWAPVASMAATSAIFDLIAKHGGSSCVAVHVPSNGMRELITTRRAEFGEVLLEVPLECCFSDFGAERPVAIEPPKFTKSLPWEAQLACSVLAHRRSSPLLASWPSEPPPLPIFARDEELSLACDESFARKVLKQRRRCATLYARAREASEASGCPDAIRIGRGLLRGRDGIRVEPEL